jgi:general stress protein 26
MRDIIDTAKTCFFCTVVPAGDPGGARPMSVLNMDDGGHLWFLSASDSHHNRELARDPSVRLYFQGSAHSDFLTLNGHATVSTDRAKIEELWEPTFKTWFTGGLDDPRITVLRVTPTDGYYWDTKHGTFVAGVKMLIGATLGKTMDDSIQGKLSV